MRRRGRTGCSSLPPPRCRRSWSRWPAPRGAAWAPLACQPAAGAARLCSGATGTRTAAPPTRWGPQTPSGRPASARLRVCRRGVGPRARTAVRLAAALRRRPPAMSHGSRRFQAVAGGASRPADADDPRRRGGASRRRVTPVVRATPASAAPGGVWCTRSVFALLVGQSASAAESLTVVPTTSR